MERKAEQEKLEEQDHARARKREHEAMESIQAQTRTKEQRAERQVEKNLESHESVANQMMNLARTENFGAKDEQDQQKDEDAEGKDNAMLNVGSEMLGTLFSNSQIEQLNVVK